MGVVLMKSVYLIAITSELGKNSLVLFRSFAIKCVPKYKNILEVNCEFKESTLLKVGM